MVQPARPPDPNAAPDPERELWDDIARMVDKLLYGYHSYRAAIAHRRTELLGGEAPAETEDTGRRTSSQWSDPTFRQAARLAVDPKLRRWGQRVQVIEDVLASLAPPIARMVTLYYGIEPEARDRRMNTTGLTARQTAEAIGESVQLVERWRRGVQTAVAQGMGWWG